MLCCIFSYLSAPQADLTRFRQVIVRWVSTAKRKTRLHTDFRNARHSKQINPLKITLPSQFLRRIKEDMFKVHVSLLATQFRPQHRRYDTFFCKIALLTTSSNVSGTFSRFAWYVGQLLFARPGVLSNNLSTCKPKCFLVTLLLY